MDRMVHPPLVDTTACLCRVDGELKTGTKMCLQPRIKPSIHPSRSKPTRGDRSFYQSPLLPRLPDDLAIACLIRVPCVEHRKLRLVCKRWYRLLTSNFFYSLRKSFGIAEEWIYIIKRDRDGKISWHAFDPYTNSGSHSLQSPRNIPKPLGSDVPSLVVVTFICLVAKIH